MSCDYWSFNEKSDHPCIPIRGKEPTDGSGQLAIHFFGIVYSLPRHQISYNLQSQYSVSYGSLYLNVTTQPYG